MLTKPQPNGPGDRDPDDASLVAAALAGDRDAFGRIVARYQALLCSIAYASLGSLAYSEDLAQEAFVEAWKKLANLDEPEKLKSWLCGILRFKLSHHRRRESRQPLARAADLQYAHHVASDTPDAEDYTMKEEEQALLWQSLEKVPESYREVLVLYYREHRSVANVADELELSEAVVKQRLSRGRKMLQERVMAFVEEALARSTPGHVFTTGVIAALSMAVTAPAKAAGTGAVATQAAGALKWTGFAAFLASVSGFVSSALALRASLDRTRTRRERRRVIRAVVAFVGIALLFAAGLFGLRQWALASDGGAVILAWVAQAVVIGFIVGYLWLTRRLLSDMRSLRSAERLRCPERFTGEEDQPGSSRREYRSRLSLFGLPLVHIKFALPEESEPPAVGWIAAGERAYGVLFAWGGYAVGLVRLGIVAVGVVGLGAVGFGVVGVGTVGVGLLAIGAAAIGLTAFGSLSSLAWQGAFSNGFSVAREAAIGPVAVAEQANNALAAETLKLS
jgi:RNA polymerase sigma factor (sigma-70 family)